MSPISAVFFLPLLIAGVCTADKVAVDLDHHHDAHGVKHVEVGCPVWDTHVFVVETGHEAHELKHHGVVFHTVAAGAAAVHDVVLLKHHVHEVVVVNFDDGAKKHFVFAKGHHELACEKAVAKLFAEKDAHDVAKCVFVKHDGKCPHGHHAAWVDGKCTATAGTWEAAGAWDEHAAWDADATKHV